MATWPKCKVATYDERENHHTNVYHERIKVVSLLKTIDLGVTTFSEHGYSSKYTIHKELGLSTFGVE